MLPEVTISSVPVRASGADTAPTPSFMNGPPPVAAPNGPQSAPNGSLVRSGSLDTDPAGDNSNTGSSGPDPALLEPLQEMTEGEEPLQVRRDLDSPAADVSADSPAGPFSDAAEPTATFAHQMEVRLGGG